MPVIARRCALAVALAFASAFAGTSTPRDVLPYAEVRAGMKGVGRTVLHGEESETFEVEILGKLDRVGPGQNIILARLGSPSLAATGVLEGMSGSPVWLDGKMIGAVAYSWEFSREAIAGITPIEEMISIPTGTSSPVPPGSAAPSATERLGSLERTDDLLDPRRAAARYEAALGRLARGGSAGAFPPLGLPVAVSGMPLGWLSARIPQGPGGAFRLRMGGASTGASGVPPAAGAGASPLREGHPAPLAPGDAVGAQLVRGDIDFTAFGTVTRVDGDRVLAFGHPFLQLGEVGYGMTRARVETLLPSLSSSFKFAASSQEVGVFDQDRSTGIAGRLGARARMVPVRLRIESEGTPPRSFAYEIAEDPLLTPILLYLTIGGVLEAAEKGAGESTVQLEEGSVLLLDEDRKADVSNLFAGQSAVMEASAMVGLIADALLRNEHETVRIQGANLIVRYSDGRRGARITGAWADRAEVRPGERLTLTVGLKPFREPESRETVTIEIPKELSPGRLTLHVGDARTLTRVEQAGADGLLPLDLEDLLALINTLRKNQSLAILGTREEPSILIGSEPFPNLPPSKSSLILRRESRGTFPILRTRSILDESRDTDYLIEGYRRVEIEVVR